MLQLHLKRENIELLLYIGVMVEKTLTYYMLLPVTAYWDTWVKVIYTRTFLGERDLKS